MITIRYDRFQKRLQDDVGNFLTATFVRQQFINTIHASKAETMLNCKLQRRYSCY